MKLVFKIILILLLLVLLVLGYFIFIARRPKDLGIRYTDQDRQSAATKIAVVYQTLPADTPPDKSLVVVGKQNIDATFNQAELTALVDNRNYKHFPFTNVQIRVNPDNTIDSSAIMSFATGVDYLKTLGISEQDINAAADWLKLPRTTLPVYFNFSGNITDNDLSLNIHQAALAHIPIPSALVDMYAPALEALVEEIVSQRSSSYDIKSLTVENNQVHYVGTSPVTERYVPR